MADQDDRDEPTDEVSEPEEDLAATDAPDGGDADHVATDPSEGDDADDEVAEDAGDAPTAEDAAADTAEEGDADGEAAADEPDEPEAADEPDQPEAADEPDQPEAGDEPDEPTGDTRDRAEVLAVYASARLVDTDAVVGAIAFDPDDAGRELQDGREISGWSVFAGEETDEELEDAERLRLPSLAWVLQRDPAVALVTSGHDGSAGYWARHGERDDGLPNWVRIVP